MRNIKFANVILALSVTFVNIFKVFNSVNDLEFKPNWIPNSCMLKIIEMNLKKNATVTIFFLNNYRGVQKESVIVDNLFTSLKWSVYLYTQFNQNKIPPYGIRRNFIIVLGTKSLRFMLAYLHSFNVWDSKAKFIIIVEGLENQKGLQIENYYEPVADLTPRIIVLHMKFNESTSDYMTEFFVSFPNQINSKSRMERLISMGSCHYGHSNLTTRELQLEHSPELKLSVGAINAPPFVFILKAEDMLWGSEINLINLIAEKLNITVTYYNYSNMDNLGDVYESNDNENIHGSGMLNDLVLNKIDIGIGNIIISQRVHKYLATSIAYSMDRIAWIVPAPQKVIKFPFVPFIFDFQTTLLLVSMYLVFPFLAHRASNYFNGKNNECPRYRTFRGTCITFFAMATSTTVDIHPKTIKMRFFFFIWLFYTYHLNMFFGTTLITFLTHDNLGPTMKTVDELVVSKMDLGIDKRSSYFFKDPSTITDKLNSPMRGNKRKFDYCNSTKLCLSKVARDRNFSMSLSYNYFKFARNQYMSNDRYLLTSLQESIVSIPVGMVFKKVSEGFKLERKFNVILLRINEAGLFKHWNEITQHQLHIRNFSLCDPDDIDEESHYSLTYSDLKLVFVATIFELLGCGLTFAGELGWYKFKNRVRNERNTVDTLFEYVN